MLGIEIGVMVHFVELPSILRRLEPRHGADELRREEEHATVVEKHDAAGVQHRRGLLGGLERVERPGQPTEVGKESVGRVLQHLRKGVSFHVVSVEIELFRVLRESADMPGVKLVLEHDGAVGAFHAGELGYGEPVRGDVGCNPEKGAVMPVYANQSVGKL